MVEHEGVQGVGADVAFGAAVGFTAGADGVVPELAAQLLITPTLEQLGGGLASGSNTGTGLTT